MTNEESPKIVSDENWKQQAQHEKEKLSQEDKPSAPDRADTPAEDHEQSYPHTMPEANMATLIESLAIQILYALGKIQDSSGSQPQVNLDLAKHHIDTLQVLQDKTKNNLTQEETKTLSLRLHEVRMQYVAVAQQA